MKVCPTCKMEKNYEEFGNNTKSCKSCNKKSCVICKTIFSPTGKKTHCSNKCKILGNIIENENGCWEWQKSKVCGYGRTRDYETKKDILAHRLSYNIFKGSIPENKSICHSCDNPSCCNPEHLWIGSHRENMLDSNQKGRTYKVSYDSKGLKNGNAKISEEEVRNIRKLSSEGMRDCDIARKYKMSQTNVRRIKRGYLWKHID